MATKSKKTKDEAEVPADDSKHAKITFNVKHVKIEKKDDGEYATVVVESPIDFLTECVAVDETFDSFLEKDPGVQKYLARKIGVKSLLATYDKKDVLTSVGWDYVKEFFMDHINHAEILDHMGYEKVREHFSDKIQAETGSKNDINKSGKSVLEALDESEGKNS